MFENEIMRAKLEYIESKFSWSWKIN